MQSERNQDRGGEKHEVKQIKTEKVLPKEKELEISEGKNTE